MRRLRVMVAAAVLALGACSDEPGGSVALLDTADLDGEWREVPSNDEPQPICGVDVPSRQGESSSRGIALLSEPDNAELAADLPRVIGQTAAVAMRVLWGTGLRRSMTVGVCSTLLLIVLSLVAASVNGLSVGGVIVIVAFWTVTGCAATAAGHQQQVQRGSGSGRNSDPTP